MRYGRLLLIACVPFALWASTAADGQPSPPRASAASCAVSTPALDLSRARLVMDGTMLRGRTVRLGRHRVLASPARMRVSRYIKGHGPRTVRVQTGLTPSRGGVSVAEDAIEPRAGERWRIYTTSRRMPYETSICAGSRRLRRAQSSTATADATVSMSSATRRST